MIRCSHTSPFIFYSMLLLVTVVVGATVAVAAAEQSTVEATLKQGAILGSREETTTGRVYYTFKNIPYATPPVGSLRFKVRCRYNIAVTMNCFLTGNSTACKTDANLDSPGVFCLFTGPRACHWLDRSQERITACPKMSPATYNESE